MNFKLKEANILYNTAEGYLSKLSKEEMMNLFEDYYCTQMENSELIQKYLGNVDYNLSIKNLFPYVESESEVCPNCGQLLAYRMPNRSDYLKSFNPKKLVCLKCDHVEGEHITCHCPTCENARNVERKKSEELERQKQIEKERDLVERQYELRSFITEYKENHPRKLVENLSIRERAEVVGFLLCSSKGATLYDIDLNTPVGYLLAPSKQVTNAIINKMLFNNLIVFSYGCPVEAFDTKFTRWDTSLVHYDLNLRLQDEDKYYKLYMDLMRDNDIPVKNSESSIYEELLELWIDIAEEECIEYLKYQMNRMGWKFNCGSKVQYEIGKMLKYRSVSEVWCLMNRSISSVSKYVLRKGLDVENAANLAVEKFLKLDKAYRKQGWMPGKYTRINDLPQSAISMAFSEFITDLYEEEFTVVPSIDALKDRVLVKYSDCESSKTE